MVVFLEEFLPFSLLPILLLSLLLLQLVDLLLQLGKLLEILLLQFGQILASSVQPGTWAGLCTSSDLGSGWWSTLQFSRCDIANCISLVFLTIDGWSSKT